MSVWVKCGICSADSLINILLCCLGFVPGLFHAWYIIAKFPEPAYEYEAVPGDREDGRVTYVYVQQHGGQGCRDDQQPRPQGAMNYGTRGDGQPRPAQQQSGVAGAGGGNSNNDSNVPPSYADVVAGDHKVQPSN